jgi:hypothetical protein
VVVWALMNTASLTSATPSLQLRNTTVDVDRYTIPPLSSQKVGDFPLGQCINDTTAPTPFGPGCWQFIFLTEPRHNEVEGKLDSSDSRVLSTSFANHHLFGTLDTGATVGGKTQAAVLWYVISPELQDGNVSAELEQQGHIAVADNNAMYGSVAATHTGKAALGFTLVGANHFPSAAYVTLSAEDRQSRITVAAEGLGPQDGFSEYNSLSNSGVARPRWGDYGAAVATDNNTVWIANEFIAQTCTLAHYMSGPFGSCGGTRSTLGNWATRITEVDVRDAGSD